MALSEKKKEYKLPANQIFSTLFDALKSNSNFANVSSNEAIFQITVITLPSIKTQGEKMIITIESNSDSSSTVHVQSESLKEEYDCGRNALNTTVMFRTIDQLFKASPQKKSKPNFTNYDRTAQEGQLAKKVKPMSKIISTIHNTFILMPITPAVLGLENKQFTYC